MTSQHYELVEFDFAKVLWVSIICASLVKLYFSMLRNSEPREPLPTPFIPVEQTYSTTATLEGPSSDVSQVKEEQQVVLESPMSSLAIDFEEVERQGSFYDPPGEAIDSLSNILRVDTSRKDFEVFHLWHRVGSLLVESNFGAVPDSWANQVLHMGDHTPTDPSEFVPYGPGRWWVDKDKPLVVVVKLGSNFSLEQLVHIVSNLDFSDGLKMYPHAKPRHCPVRVIQFADEPYYPPRERSLTYCDLADAWIHNAPSKSWSLKLGNAGRWPVVLELRPEHTSLDLLAHDEGGNRLFVNCRHTRLSRDSVITLTVFSEERPLAWPFLLRCLFVAPVFDDSLYPENVGSLADLRLIVERPRHPRTVTGTDRLGS